MLKSKHSQEEMIGFVLIIVLVMIILLVFLGFALRSPQKEIVESYEAESFLKASLQYTSSCKNNLEYLSIKSLISECEKENECANGEKSCDVLKETLKGIIKESWKYGPELPIKGYELNITSENEDLFHYKNGDFTKNSKGTSESFTKGSKKFDIIFNLYY